MDSSPPWWPQVSERLGLDGRPEVTALGTRVWRLAAPGASLVVKTGPGVAAEAEGLLALGAATTEGGPAVPEVLIAEEGLLVEEWVPTAPAGPAHDERLGRALAALHRRPWPAWGGGSAWIGDCPVDPAERPDAASFYGGRLVQLAGRLGLGAEVGPVVERLDGLLPPGPPALVHGDLWWGNVLAGADGRPWLIDPSAHGGHPEEDLAMLALFGSVSERLIGAYQDLLRLADGWRERVGLWQLSYVLVHAVLFGGSYPARATELARRYS